MVAAQTQQKTAASATAAKPRLGFIGLGWIGRARMAALREAGLAHIAAMVDVDEAALRAASQGAPEADLCDSFESLFEAGVDGVVIATPNLCHAGQALAAIERGVAVFCQKPLATKEVEAHVAALRLIDGAYQGVTECVCS